MTTEDIKIVESITGDVMDILGYQRAIIQKGKEIIFSDTDINQFTQDNLISKENTASNIDANDLKRRKLQIGFLDKISEEMIA